MRRSHTRKKKLKRKLLLVLFLLALGGVISLGFRDIPATTTLVQKDIPSERFMLQQ